MGEIKSTLDLVMEKTKHLTLSDEEKVTQRRVEAEKKIYGLVKKYQDNLIAKTNLEKEMDVFRQAYDLDVDDILMQTLVEDLELGGKNAPLLELLRDVCDVDISGLERLFQDFLTQVRDAEEERIKTIKDNLHQKRSISGAAVVPNLGADNEWLSMLSAIKARFDEALSQEKSAI